MFKRYEGEAWNKRFLPRLTALQVQQLPKEQALVVLSLGAVEQHGNHLPVMTDALIGEETLTRAFEKLSANAQVWMLPPIAYGKSNEHLGLPGTIALSASTLQHVILDIAESLKLSGFRKLVLFNTHGGNADLINMAAREIRIKTGLTVFSMMPSAFRVADDLFEAYEWENGIHGGDVETSIVLSIKPDWVNMKEAVREFPNLDRYLFLTLESSVRFAWTMNDISASGIVGDATIATAEKGEVLQDRVSSLLAKVFEELCTFEIEQVRTNAMKAEA